MGDDSAGGETSEAEAWAEYLRSSPIVSNVPLTSHPSERVNVELPKHPAVWTLPARVLVASPAIAVTALLLLLLGRSLSWALLILVLGPISMLGSLLLARADARGLREFGYPEVVHPVWALIPVVYLLKRARLGFAVNSSSYRPFWAYLGVVGLSAVLVPVANVLGAVGVGLEQSRDYWGI